MSGIHGEGLVTLAGEGEGQRATPPPYVVPVNGRHEAADAPRRMPVETRRVHLDGKYAGWWFDLNADAPFGLFLRVMDLQGAASADEAAARKAFAELVQLLPELVLDWNFVDRAGDPIPCDGAGLLRLPLPLIQTIFANIGPEQPDAPKDSSGNSAPTSTTGASPRAAGVR